jgi:hypothetical protein
MNVSQQATQPMQLIKQMQDDRDALVVYAEIHLEIPDQPRPRKASLRKEECLSAGKRHQPFRVNPASNVGLSRCDRSMNSWVSILTLPWTAADCPPQAATAR